MFSLLHHFKLWMNRSNILMCLRRESRNHNCFCFLYCSKLGYVLSLTSLNMNRSNILMWQRRESRKPWSLSLVDCNNYMRNSRILRRNSRIWRMRLVDFKQSRLRTEPVRKVLRGNTTRCDGRGIMFIIYTFM